MRKIQISDCKPGMISGRPVYYKGALMLETGAVLTQSYINRLAELGITEIYIEDDISRDITLDDVVQNKTRQEAVKFIIESMDNYTKMELFDSTEATALVKKIIDEILDVDNIMVNLMDIKTCDTYTFLHCVNVCILAIITGLKLNLSYSELRELGVGALLHDIGKVLVPSTILMKQAALTENEYAIIKQHSILGYNILRKLPHISEASARVALDHHERADGNGYPGGLVKQHIHIYSRIVAITDVFDSLTSDRIYRKKISTNQAIKYLITMAETSFDGEILDCFQRLMPPFPIGTGVILNNGEKGVIVKANSKQPAKPVVRIVFNSDGSKKAVYDEVNLAEEQGYVIVNDVELIR